LLLLAHADTRFYFRC